VWNLVRRKVRWLQADEQLRLLAVVYVETALVLHFTEIVPCWRLVCCRAPDELLQLSGKPCSGIPTQVVRPLVRIMHVLCWSEGTLVFGFNRCQTAKTVL